MSHDVVSHIALYQEVMNPMSSDGSVEGVVDGTVSHVGPIHTATQVEVDGIATQTECLSTLTHFNMFNPVTIER